MLWPYRGDGPTHVRRVSKNALRAGESGHFAIHERARILWTAANIENKLKTLDALGHEDSNDTINVFLRPESDIKNVSPDGKNSIFLLSFALPCGIVESCH